MHPDDPVDSDAYHDPHPFALLPRLTEAEVVVTRHWPAGRVSAETLASASLTCPGCYRHEGHSPACPRVHPAA